MKKYYEDGGGVGWECHKDLRGSKAEKTETEAYAECSCSKQLA